MNILLGNVETAFDISGSYPQELKYLAGSYARKKSAVRPMRFERYLKVLSSALDNMALLQGEGHIDAVALASPACCSSLRGGKLRKDWGASFPALRLCGKTAGELSRRGPHSAANGAIPRSRVQAL